jgi:hypothetical protein
VAIRLSARLRSFLLFLCLINLVEDLFGANVALERSLCYWPKLVLLPVGRAVRRCFRLDVVCGVAYPFAARAGHVIELYRCADAALPGVGLGHREH